MLEKYERYLKLLDPSSGENENLFTKAIRDFIQIAIQEGVEEDGMDLVLGFAIPLARIQLSFLTFDLLGQHYEKDADLYYRDFFSLSQFNKEVLKTAKWLNKTFREGPFLPSLLGKPKHSVLEYEIVILSLTYEYVNKKFLFK
jgi:hypothetical protein